MTIAEVIAQRTINKGLLQSEQRDDCRKFLIKNPLSSSKFGLQLHANNAERTLCVVGFDVFNGYTLGYTYRRAREVRAGIGQDDVQGGGRMKGQKSLRTGTPVRVGQTPAGTQRRHHRFWPRHDAHQNRPRRQRERPRSQGREAAQGNL